MHKHPVTRFALAAHYSKEILTKENECFSYKEDGTVVFSEKTKNSMRF